MFEMKNPADHKRNPATAYIASTLVLALLIAPFCGPICAASNSCPNAAAMTDSADDCHHAQISTNSNSATASSPKLCSRHELPALVTAQQESLPSLEASAVPILRSSAEPTDPSGFRLQSKSDHSPKSTPPSTSTTILRL